MNLKNKTTKLYGKEKERINFIYSLSIENIDKNIMILDLEEDINKLYPLTQLNTIKIIILNSSLDNMLSYFDLLEDKEVDTIIINGSQNIEEEIQIELDLFIKKVGHKLILLSNNKKDIKIKSKKVKKIEKSIFKINKRIDLEEDSYFIKRSRVIMIEDKIV